MAKTPENVQDFLEKLANKIYKKGKKEIFKLILFKRQLGDLNPLYAWDIGYYAKKFFKAKFHI